MLRIILNTPNGPRAFDVRNEKLELFAQECGGTFHIDGSAEYLQPKKKPVQNKIQCPYDNIVEIWHEMLVELPPVLRVNETRKGIMNVSWDWILSSKKSSGERRATNSEEALAWIKLYFSRVRLVDWVMGRVNGRKGSFDYVISMRGIEKLTRDAQDALQRQNEN